METLVKDIAFYLLSGLAAMIAWFLRSKDEAQQRQIALLFTKHDEDAAQLSELKERIAREHYVKGELDARFQRLEDAFRDGFHDLGAKIDKLTEVFLDHIAKSKP
jgi:hypothetical protein